MTDHDVVSRVRMHADEVFTDVALVRALLADQFPAWATLPVVPLDSFGTDHDVYRLGERHSVRLPRVAGAMAQADKEARWLPVLAQHLPLAVPAQVGAGEPAAGYPYRWSVCAWMDGQDASVATVDRGAAAHALAGFVQALHSVDTTGAHARPAGSRGGPLAAYDDDVRAALAELGDRVDTAAVTRAWDDALEAPRGAAPDVWVHADLLPGNLIVRDGRLVAVIDWGGLNVGDPACDLICAWNVMDASARRTFRDALVVDDVTWRRGRGWTILQAIVALPYYWHTNPRMVRQALRAVHEVLADETD